MKDHFIKLFKYDHYASQAILKAIIEDGAPQPARRLMEHLLVAQNIWFNRCNLLPQFEKALWNEDWESTEITAKTINDNYNRWVSYLQSVDNFDNTIAYKNLRGDSYENKLSDIITHVINHGTHHRAQIGQHLKSAGINELPVTDYIAFVRHI